MRKGQRTLRRIIVAFAMLLVMVGLPLAWYQVSVQPGAAIIRFAVGVATSAQAKPVPAIENGSVTLTKDIAVRVAGAPDAHLNLYAPADYSTEHPVVLWIHGGGFIASSADDVAGYAAALAEAGYIVGALEYALAPEARYPTPIIQANAALAWVNDNIEDFGGDPDRIFIGGDSAGAQIASQLAVTQTDASFAESLELVPALEGDQVRGVVLFCGLYDMHTVSGIAFPALRTFPWSYTGQRDWMSFPRIEELSTTANATAAYPPTFIGVGDADPFAPQSEGLATALTGLGVEVRTEFWENQGLGHEYQFDLTLWQARATLERTLRFLAENSLKENSG